MAYRKEWKEVKNYLLNDSTDQQAVCKERTEYCLNWFIKRACLHKTLFYIFTIISTACPLLSSVILVCIDCKLLTIILTSITTMSGTLLAMFNCRGNWDNYRSTAEYLKKEYCLYKGMVSPYDGKDREEKYLMNIEEFMGQTNKKWKEFFEDGDENNNEDNTVQ